MVKKYFQILHNIKNNQSKMSLTDRKNGSSKDCSNDASSSIATFVVKIYNLLSDPQNASAICWDEGGKSFTIRNISLLTSQVLPHYFRHNNYQSFIRQLNMYSFTKLKDHTAHRFQNPFFIRERDELLKNIKRKPQKKKRRQSDDSIPNQKENEDKLGLSSCKLIAAQMKEENGLIKAGLQVKEAQEQVVKKKVGFLGLCEGNGESEDHISTIIEVTSKWINNKEQSYWSNIKSFKSIKSVDLSMKLIPQDEDKQEYSTENVNNSRHIPTQGPIILLFNPNLTERTLKQL